ncbi:GFA family protein [Marivibrio halodurans]|uniref:GFA family protein n=1 Tax=Marivibrio halodurans TaxID=2039722 RepID=A0A8J7SL68_9PROT|nr:GFA family protein [Marivibrio halodurans]MBP5856668.1 GFA family protein [Marivibrio halodurans]
MHLEGSCHCRAVTFALEAPHPVPFARCYCEICRKTAGAGGFAINIGGVADSLQVSGEENITRYRAVLRDDTGAVTGESPMARSFCKRCGSQLWGWDPRWPDLIHPHASAIDTPLPTPPEHVHLMLGSKAPWAEPAVAPKDKSFEGYPDESLAAWHERLGLEG